MAFGGAFCRCHFWNRNGHSSEKKIKLGHSPAKFIRLRVTTVCSCFRRNGVSVAGKQNKGKNDRTELLRFPSHPIVTLNLDNKVSIRPDYDDIPIPFFASLNHPLESELHNVRCHAFKFLFSKLIVRLTFDHEN